MKLTTYAIKMISTNIRDIERHIKKAEKGNEAALHQFRVNIRRLQNGLTLFKKLFPQIVVAEWLIEVRYAIQETNQVRDLDVYIQFLRGYLETLKNPVEENVIKGVIRQLKGKRKKKQNKVIQVIKGLDNAQIFHKINERMSARAWYMKGKKEERIYEFCSQRVLKRIRDIFDYEEYIGKPECMAELHKLRIKNKHLRYTLEGLKKIYDKRIDAYIQKVTVFHYLLGDIHDYDVWARRITKLLKEDPLNDVDREILVRLKDYCHELRNKAYQEFCIQWHDSKENLFFENMGEYVYSF